MFQKYSSWLTLNSLAVGMGAGYYFFRYSITKSLWFEFAFPMKLVYKINNKVIKNY